MSASVRPTRPAAPAALVLLILAAAILALPATAAAETVPNAAGRYDGLALRDLGGKQAALVQLVAEGGAFAPVELWRSKKGAFDLRKATFAAGDVNGDGIGDGIVLYDLGRSRSRLYVYLSDGMRATQTIAWTSKAGAFAKTKAKLAVTDLDSDGRDDLIALYDRGRSSAALYRFVSSGTKFKQTTGWSGSGFSWAKAQLAAGDVTGDGRGDAIVLYGSSATSARLDVFVGGATTFTKKTFWSGQYAAGQATLAAGDADSDGACDAVCLARASDGSGRLDVFLSSKTAFSAPAVWYAQTGGPPVPTASRFAVGDVTGDGRADVVTAASAGGSVTRVTTWVSEGSSFTPQLWWEGGWAFTATRLGMAPSSGMVVSDKAEVLNAATNRYLRVVEADGTLTFAGETGQLSRMEKGDVVLAGASDAFPNGVCRKVTAIGEQNGRVVVETAQATLSDVIDQGEVAFSKHITADDLPDEGIVAPGVRIERDAPPPGALPVALGGSSADGIRFTLTTTILGVAEAEGEVSLDPDTYCDWDIGLTGLKSAYFTQVLTTNTDLTVSIKQTANLVTPREQTLYKRTLTAITIMVGPVPVVVTPVFEVKVGVKGEITAGVTAGLTIATETSAGITYDHDADPKWDKSFTSTKEITPHRPQLFGGLEVTGFVNAGLAFKLYGVAGPEVALQPYVKLAAKTTDDPWWTLSAGLEGEIGFKVEVLDKEVLSKSFTWEFFEPFIIDQAGSVTSGGGSSDYQAPSVRGKILDATTGVPVRAASVGVEPGGSGPSQTYSAADGTYVFLGLSPGTYTVSAGKDDFADNSRSVVVVAGQMTTGQDIALTRYSLQGVKGSVFSAAGGAPIFDASVELFEADNPSYGLGLWASTGSDGSYEIQGVAPGDYLLKASLLPYCFTETIAVTVAGGQMLERDIYLVHHQAQGVIGRVVDSVSRDPVVDALVSVGTGLSGGMFEGWAYTGAGGSFSFTGLEAGWHNVRVDKPGYIVHEQPFQIGRATVVDLGDIAMKQPGGQSMRSQSDNAWIRWPEALSSSTHGTFELWFRPGLFGIMDYDNTIAEISRVYPDWDGGGSLAYRPTMRIKYMMSGYDTVFGFLINENTGGSTGTWHRVMATTPLELGHWYHVAAVYGAPGMRLFVNGILEDSNDYTGAPQADPGIGTGGWFSLGGVTQSVYGDFKGLRVSDVPRYDADFTPPQMPEGGAGTLVLDSLAGTTNGYNEGFVPTP